MNAHAELRRFTVEEYEKLGETGFFQPDERVELLDGEIVTMAPIGKWIVNLADACVEVYRQPQGDDYAEHFRRTPGQTLVSLAFPERAMPVAELLA